MTTTTITLTFDAATIEAVVNDVVYQAELAKIPNTSLVKIVQYGMQRIVNDKCGASTLNPEAKDVKAKETIARILNGSLAVRTRAGGSSDPFAKLRKYIRSILRKLVSSKAAYKAAEDKAEWLDETFDNQDEPTRMAILANAQAAYDAEHSTGLTLTF